MTDQLLVSILMTAYNREKYIGFAIESVIASTYKNWELIIVDDCSKDNTVQIARKYELADARIKIYVNETNLGDYPNRNKAASYAKGKYIKYVDADDAIYYWSLQVEVELMERNPEAAYGLDDIPQDDDGMPPYLLDPAQAYYTNYVKHKAIFNKAPTSCIIKRDVFIKENGFKALRMVGDNELWHRLSRSYSVLLMPQGLIWGRGHEDSESGKLMQDFMTQYHYLIVYRDALEHPQCPLESKHRKSILKIIAKSQLKIKLKTLLKGDIKAYKKIKDLDTVGMNGLMKKYLSS